MKRLLALTVAASILVLAGCPTAVPKHGKFEETEFFPDGSVKKKTTAESDYSLYIGANKNTAPVAKVSLPAPGGGVYSVEIPMVAGQTQQIAPPQQEIGTLDKWFDRGMRVTELLLRGYGIARNADVAIEQSRNAMTERIAATSGYVQMGAQTADLGKQGFVSMGQIPRSNNINVSGNALIGDGDLTIDNSVRRTCTGGAGADGGNGAGTTTGARGGEGGTGGPANC